MYSYLADANDVFRDINVAELDKNTNQARIFLKRALSTSVGTNLTSQILPTAAKLLASTDLVTKKLASWYIARHSNADSDVSVLAVNTLLTDVRDPNPVVRSLAVRTLAGIQLPELAEHGINAVNSGLKDTDAVVRRAAVLACVQIFQTAPSAVLERGLVDRLYALIRDPDPIVVVNCLDALQEILSDEGGVVVNRNMARYLLQWLKSSPEPQCATLLKYLTKYQPRDEAEALNIMNVADVFLDSSNAVIVVSTLRYFLNIVTHSGLSHLRTDVVKRAEDSLFRLVSSDSHETVYAVIRFMREELVGEFTSILCGHHLAVLCHSNDPPYLKVVKIQLLSDIAYESSVRVILDELGTQARNKSTKVAEAAVTAIGKLASRFNAERAGCVSLLVSLVSAVTDMALFTTVLQVLHKFDLRTSADVSQLLKIVESRLVDSSDSKSLSSMVVIFGQCADLTDTGPYLIEHVLKNCCSSLPVCSQLLTSLLTACTRLFLRRPAQYQHVLGQVFEFCMNSPDVDVRDKAAMYYMLLSTDISLANSVILSAAWTTDADQL